MDFKLNEIVCYGNGEAEILATKNELLDKVEIALLVNGKVVKTLVYHAGFDYLICVNKSNQNEIGNLVLCNKEDILKK